jgi:hypothetical protein
VIAWERTTKMKYENAKNAIEKIQAAIEILNESICDVHETESRVVYAAYVGVVTEAWVVLLSKLLNPLYRQHQSLMPNDFGLNEKYLSAKDETGL